MTLHEYLCERKKNDPSFKEKNFSAEIGIDPCYFWQIKTGKKIPSFKLAKKIEQVTNGKVNAYELMERNLCTKAQ